MNNKNTSLHSMLRLVKVVIITAIFMMINSCISIMQYQRQFLGDPLMLFDDDSLEKDLNDHVFPRREGSSGGMGGSGGGCGC